MKWIFSILLLLVSSASFGQGFSYSYVDPCSKKTNTVYIPSGQGSVTVSYYGASSTFTQADFQNGVFSSWMYTVSAASSQPCQGLKTETQTKTNTIITNNIISTLTSVTAAATMSVTSSISTVSSQSAGTALGNSVNNSSDNSSGGGSSKENKDGQNNSGSKSNNQESGTSGQPQGGGTTTNSSQGTNKTEGGSTSGTNQPTEGGNQPSGSPVGGNTAQNQPNTSPNTGNSGSNTGNSSNTTQTGSNTGNNTQSGTNTGQNGGSGTQSGTNTGNAGGSGGTNTGNTGSNTGNSGSGGGNTGNSGSNTNNTGGSGGSGGSGGGTDTKTNTTDPTTTPTDTKSGGNGGTTNSVANAAEASSGGSTSNASEGSGGGGSKGGAKSNVRVGSIIGTGDIVAMKSAEDNTNSFKATMSVTKSNTDNSRAKGALLNFTTAINNSNLTFYGAFTNKSKSNTLICANSTMVNFDYDLFNTTTVLESHRFNKLSLMGGINYTIGSIAETSFSNISAVGGGFYSFKASKNISGNMLLLAVYSPFTKFYEGTWWQSGTLLVPFSSWDYSISKKFKYNISFSGTWEVGKSVLQYQILTGGKIML